MIVHIDKDHEKFLCESLQMLSKYKEEDIQYYMFAAAAGDDIIMAVSNCTAMDKAFIATHLQMQANAEFMLDSMLELKQDMEDESED